MSWSNMVDLSAGSFVNEADMDAIRQNLEFLGGLRSGGEELKDLSSNSDIGLQLLLTKSQIGGVSASTGGAYVNISSNLVMNISTPGGFFVWMMMGNFWSGQQDAAMGLALYNNGNFVRHMVGVNNFSVGFVVPLTLSAGIYELTPRYAPPSGWTGSANSVYCYLVGYPGSI